MLIDPQRHGRVCVVGLQDAFPICRIVLPQPANPPGGVVPARNGVAVGGGYQCITLTQKAAQAGVDEGGLPPRGLAALGGFYRLVDQGEGLIGRGLRVPRQRQRRAQQRVCRRGRLAGDELAAQCIGPTQVAQHLEQQRLHTGAQTRFHALDHRRTRLPSANALQRLAHQHQLLPQGHAGARRRCRRWRTGRCGGRARSGGLGTLRRRSGGVSGRAWGRGVHQGIQ